MGENLMSLARSGGKYLKLFGDGKMVKTLPYDAEVEWLENGDGAFAKTGVSIGVDSEINLEFKYSAPYVSGYPYWKLCYGFRNHDMQGGQGKSQFQINYNYQDKTIALDASDATSNTTAVTADEFHDVKGVISENLSASLYVDGLLVFTRKISLIIPDEVWLFRSNDTHAGSSSKRNQRTSVKKARIVSMGSVLFDAIPVRFTNENGVSEGAMFDRVSGKLFRNAGTGAFVIGPDKTT